MQTDKHTQEKRANLITIKDFCDLMKVSRTQFYRIIKQGKLKLLKIGKLSRIRLSDAEQWLIHIQGKAVQK